MPEFEHPAWLYGLALAVLPWWLHGQRRVMWASVGTWPVDTASRWVDIGLRCAASLALAAAALSLAGGYLQGLPIERTGTGAHLAIVLDRSASMADGFAAARQAGEESKSEAAARLLDGFVKERPLDLFGLTLFSTAPMQVLGLSSDHEAVRAALRAAATPGIGLTNVAAGLALALAQFGEQPHTGSRVILFVSDGAAQIEPSAQIKLRRLFEEYRVQLYWVYLRSPGSNSPTRPPDPQAGADVAPEYHLHTFFQDLGTPYRLYEADNPQALAAAISDVSRLQNLPLRYLQAQPRRNLAPWCDAIALSCALLLLLARSLEIEHWQRG
ncbi:vWA domain-containing protein [Verminephrobacter eiseniae]|uniref:vWA domain-containing protein n=1 Tax=Verminephrobacter eiseniae TaxID=364317 RepID=UPI002238E186|nr:vWA domain-containing protein [Verminephrobacter eiseniae]MCW5234577.1 VWA domain-containing protein [Verminephrobacter eiseniae]MCW5293847.1 VWA domain-containing protein [Verminephrobacter eiseniae]MCW8183854.1 VWA domain-containing protein [Verminephrobacter eiseniae]MCW8222398.1 VWA domain-containing protein [Verminephrobacter eiseniae]MCW8233994.1 VWA domain-containing protein [Verminephrobacter eiseniae]